MLHDVVLASGAEIKGHWPTDGYEFEASKAEIPGAGQFVGLGIDEDQQEELTADRLNRWCAQIHGECGLRSEEHTSELQSRGHLVCRPLREKKQAGRTRADRHRC